MGGFSSEFLEGRMAKFLLEIVDLLTSLVCELSLNRPWNQDKDRSGRC